MTARTGIDADFVGEYGEWREIASPFLDQSNDHPCFGWSDTEKAA
ncbi:hypothetical protein [Bifidobacterium catulorum]|nr:hypothetical protein [Bifidobacterium catulorum]